MVNGKPQIPFLGAGKYQPRGRKAAPAICSNKDYPDSGDKRVADLETALRKCGLRDGMVISNHHHLRDGDKVALMALEAAARIGVKDLMWFPSASFPSQKSAIELMEKGVIHHIEGSMNGPLGDYCTQGKMRGMGVLRSHGGRYQAIQDGEVHVDIAVIAAPTADFFGNADGSHGKSACGSLGFALADSIYADRVIVVTDNLVPFPCVPWQIQGNNVDFVVRGGIDRRSGENCFRHNADHAVARPPADCGAGGAVSAGSGNHEERIFVSGRSGRNRAGIRRVSEGDDERGRSQGALRSRRLNEVSG